MELQQAGRTHTNEQQRDGAEGRLRCAVPRRSAIRSNRLALAGAAVMAAASALAALPVQAQAPYPSKPIRMVVPFPAGGGYDFLGRLYAAKMSETWGQPVLVENRAGANGNIGSEVVAKAPPDGYTLLMGGIGPQALSVGLYPNLPYDPLKAFEPISLVAGQPNLLVVHPSMPVKTLKDFIAFAKARPGQISYASNGSGSGQHIAAEQLKLMTGIDIVHVPFKGAAPALTAILSGEVAVAFNVILSPLPYVKSGRLRALATASSRRASLAPDVPTMAELGYPSYEATEWSGLIGPANLPPEVASRMNAVINEAIQQPAVAEQYHKMGLETSLLSPGEFRTFLDTETAKFSELIRKSGIKAE
jgi:tripartite-type tricarboxylate transporter receptor subunit TctC